VVGVANIETDERYTLAYVKVNALKFMGLKKWSLDAAACAASHLAERYLTKKDNGLITSWWGDTVFNPPWSNIGPWLEKSWVEWNRREHERKVVRSITGILPATRTDLEWWQKHVEAFRDLTGGKLRTRFLQGRNKYGTPDDLLGKNQGTPEFGTVILGWKDW
jgi:hypothetical protein